MIDLSSIKPGDKVTVGAVVAEIHDHAICVRSGVFEDQKWLAVPRRSLISHTPAPPPIKVGDRVIRDIPGIRVEAEVIGIHRTQAWLLVAHGEAGFITEVANVARLRHAPPPR